MGGIIALAGMVEDPSETCRVAVLACIGRLAAAAHAKGSPLAGGGGSSGSAPESPEPVEVRRAMAICAPILEMHRKWGEAQACALLELSINEITTGTRCVETELDGSQLIRAPSALYALLQASQRVTVDQRVRVAQQISILIASSPDNARVIAEQPGWQSWFLQVVACDGYSPATEILLRVIEDILLYAIGYIKAMPRN